MAKLIYRDPNIRVTQPKTPLWKLHRDLQPYQYKTRRTARIEPKFIQPYTRPEEMLTGYVHGKRATPLEERFALALEFFGMDYIFQYEVVSAYSLPNEGKKIDFIVYDGGIMIPVELGAAFVHASPSQQEEERARVAMINPILMAIGIMPLSEESYVPYDRPTDVFDAREIVAGLFINA